MRKPEVARLIKIRNRVRRTARSADGALPGSRVDVALTYMVEGSLTSKVIVQNARVLSYAGSAEAPDERIGVGPRPRQARVGSTVTLEVAPPDALKIQTSKQLGSLSLLMRAPEDENPARVLQVSRPDIDGNVASTATAKRECTRGIMRMEGEEYVIDCDGSISKLRQDEP